MNVYDHIDANNRKTVAILLAFPAALFATVFLFSYQVAVTEVLQFSKIGVSAITAFTNPEEYLANTSTIVQNTRLGRSRDDKSAPFWSFYLNRHYFDQAMQITWTVYPWMTLVAFLWIWFSFYKGGDMILGMAHARRITFEENRELYRLVENTSIMGGLPTPRVYVIDDDSMNAFATGFKPETASIAMTKGIVEKLDKAELQAVVAHELAHIGNRDTRLMQFVIAGIGCFIFFAEVLTGIAIHGRKSRGRGISLLRVVGAACYVFGYVVAPVLRFALSRLQEYQADATAVKIMRDPDSLARALSKIAAEPKVEALDTCPLVGNMCIVAPTQAGFMSRLYATHPPLEDRVAVLGKMMGREPAKRTMAGKMVEFPEEWA